MSSGDNARSVLKLSDPNGAAPKGNAALGTPSVEDKIAQGLQLAENKKRIEQLERSNAELIELIERQKKPKSEAKRTNPGTTRHIGHAEGWKAVCTAADLCNVGKDIVAFNSFATLDQKQTASPNVQARGTSVYRKGDVIKKVQADAGKHIVSGTSLGSGHVKILDGQENVKVNGVPVARHDSRCLINCDASGGGGAPGKIVTEQKCVGPSGASKASNPSAPTGERTSAKLEALKAAREKVASGMVDFNASDEMIRFAETNNALDELIGKINGAPGTAADYAAQVARGLLGFGKDAVLGLGELVYEGVKASATLAQLTQTQRGNLAVQLDAQVLAENIKLGNMLPEKLADGVVAIGKAIIKPITDPWRKEHYLESITRATAEVATLGVGSLKGSKATIWANESAKLGHNPIRLGLTENGPIAHNATNETYTASRSGDGVHVNGRSTQQNAQVDRFDPASVEGPFSLLNKESRPVTYRQFVAHVENTGLTDAFSLPLSEVYSNVYVVPKSLRPEPSSYLSAHFADAHRALFAGGAARVDSTVSFNVRYKADIEAGLPFGRSDAVFTSPKTLIDRLHATGNNTSMEKELGFPKGTFSGAGSMTRTYIDKPADLGLRLARGSEGGANPYWVPGGHTFNVTGGAGTPEMITNQLPSPLINPNIRIVQ